MKGEPARPIRHRHRHRPSSFRLHPSILIAALFLAARIPLLLLRAPFFDELFTRWIAGKSFGGILVALRQDSGPPLYYFVVHLLGDPPVVMTRVLSLLFAAISVVILLRGKTAILAPLLLAVFPPALLLAVDARAYALCAMFVTMAILAVDRDHPVAAALALVAAAYSHYYGVLLFPILLIPPVASFPVVQGSRRRIASLGLAIILYIPGIWLALHQPTEARAWMSSSSWPDALFVRPPLALAFIGGIALVLSIRVNRYLLMVLVPLGLALALRVYVPMRFEAVIATPLVLSLAESLRNNRFRLALTTVLIAIGVLWSALGVIDHSNRPVDPYRQAALWVGGHIPPSQAVIASGYCYLETLMNGPDRVIPFPTEQGQHPGWRVQPRPGLQAPSGMFFWTGERGAPELTIMARQHRVIRPLFLNDRAMVALVR